MSHALVTRLQQFPGCPPVPVTLADVLWISPREARRRIRDAEQLAPRTTLTGQRLPPVLPETATAWRDVLLDGEHLQVIQRFFRDLPESVPPAEVDRPTSTTSLWPAIPTTNWSRPADGPPEHWPTATPNGSHHHNYP